MLVLVLVDELPCAAVVGKRQLRSVFRRREPTRGGLSSIANPFRNQNARISSSGLILKTRKLHLLLWAKTYVCDVRRSRTVRISRNPRLQYRVPSCYKIYFMNIPHKVSFHLTFCVVFRAGRTQLRDASTGQLMDVSPHGKNLDMDNLPEPSESGQTVVSSHTMNSETAWQDAGTDASTPGPAFVSPSPVKKNPAAAARPISKSLSQPPRLDAASNDVDKACFRTGNNVPLKPPSELAMLRVRGLFLGEDHSLSFQ